MRRTGYRKSGMQFVPSGLPAHADRYFIEEAKRVGARAYVVKTKIDEALINAIGDALESRDSVMVD